MGFIERLRLQREEANKKADVFVVQHQTDFEIERLAQVQTRDREWELQKVRKSQAKGFHEESGSGTLMHELGEAIGAEHHYDEYYEPWYIGSPHPGVHPNSYWRSVSWGEHFVGSTSEKGSFTILKKYSRKYIALETSL